MERLYKKGPKVFVEVVRGPSPDLIVKVYAALIKNKDTMESEVIDPTAKSGSLG